jgi:hypothetical protein
MTSLLDASSDQPELIPSSNMPASFFGNCPSEPRNPEFTAERYHKHHREEYCIMVSLLFGDCLPIATVARMLGRSRNLVDAVYARESNGKTVEQLKQQASREYRHLGKLGREALRQYLLNLPEATSLSPNEIGAMIQRLSVAVGIVDDKAELLSGGATARIEHTSGDSGHEAVIDYLASLKSEYDRRMGSIGGNPDANGAIDVTPEVEVEPGSAQALTPGSDPALAPSPDAPKQDVTDKESDDPLRISQ